MKETSISNFASTTIIKSNLKSKKKISFKKILLVAFLVCIVVFIFLTISWLVYFNKSVKPILEQGGLTKTGTEKDFNIYEGTLETEDFSGDITINCPKFLNFYCDIILEDQTVLTLPNNSGSTFTIDVEIDVNYFEGNKYYTTINEISEPVINTKGDDVYSYGESKTVGFIVTKDMERIHNDYSIEELETYEALENNMCDLMNILSNHFWGENFNEL